VNSGALTNLLDPAVLFFFLGLAIGAVRSNLEIPAPVAKFLSLYLLLALGFKGGQALGEAGLTAEGMKIIGTALVLATAVPALSFAVLRHRVNAFDAAAIAATYGSVSAVTFVAASEFVAGRGDPAGGYTTVALVLMESPAIVMAVVLATWVRTRGGAAGSLIGTQAVGAGVLTVPVGSPVSVTAILREAFTDGAHLLLIGSLVIGLVSGDDGGESMAPFVDGIFKGVLAFFLLEMGLLVSRQLREVRDVGAFLVGFAVAMPVLAASTALLLGWALSLGVGDMTVLAVLAGSASYIVVPAVVRFAIPEARPSRYFTMALAVTFPFNIVVGIPLYYAVAQRLA
jgi:uncharacterized protein